MTDEEIDVIHAQIAAAIFTKIYISRGPTSQRKEHIQTVESLADEATEAATILCARLA